MEFEKMKKWIELARQFQQGSFWDEMLDNDHSQQILDQLTSSSVNKSPKVIFPPADIFKSHNELIIIIDLPGVRKENVEISITHNTLNVKGAVYHGHSEMIHIQKERFDGEFDRTISLPELVMPGAKISARFNNGTLEIRIPISQRSKDKIIIE